MNCAFMKKKIAFIEPFRHYEVIAALLRLMQGEPFEVYCFCTDFCKEQIPDDTKVTFYTSPKDRLDDDFLNQYMEVLNSCSHVFFTTIDVRSTFFFNNALCAKLIGLVHNSYNFFFYKTGKIEEKSRYYLSKLRGDFQNTQKILERLDRVVVPGQSIERFISEKTKEDWTQNLSSIEIAVPKFRPLIYNRKEVVITIPGTVDQNRRDYECIARILPILDQQINTTVKLLFAGKPFSKKEKKLLERIYNSGLKNIEVYGFENYVSIATFREVLEETDFLLLPIQRFVQYKAFREERGKTCVSGNINDLIQFSLPAVIPAFYPLAKELETIVGRYDTEERLLQMLTHWINNRHFNLLKKESNFEEYKLRISKMLLSVFSK